MEKVTTVMGTIVLGFGMIQGLSFGVAEYPLIDGIIGGVLPLLAGAIGFFLVSWKSQGETIE